jgi:predicted metallo-beta-lactamase superfamily hydrolase
VAAADGVTAREIDCELSVSAPLPHGQEGTPYGSVVALTVTDPAERARFVFASDVQGPLSPVVTAWLIAQRPTILYLAGPPSYLEREVGRPAIDQGIDNLHRIIKATGCRVILDHHALRDARYESRFESLWATGRVLTAAAFLHVTPAPLESRRHLLWAGIRRPGARAGTRSGAAPETTRRPARSRADASPDRIDRWAREAGPRPEGHSSRSGRDPGKTARGGYRS